MKNKLKHFNLIIIAILAMNSMLISCSRNYEKEMSEILKKYNAVPIQYNLEGDNRYLIYHDYKSVYYDDFNSERTLLFDRTKKYVIKELKPEITNEGTLHCKEHIYGSQEVNFSSLYDLNSNPSFELELLAYDIIDKRIVGICGGPLNHIEYLYDKQKPDTLIRIASDASWHNDHYEFCIHETMWNFPGFYNYYKEVAPDACYSSLFEDKNMATFYCKVSIDTFGNINFKLGENIFAGGKWFGEGGIIKDLSDFDENSNAKALLSSTISVNNLGTKSVLDFFEKITDFYQDAYKKKQIATIIENSIELSQLSNAFKNRVKAEEELIGTELCVYLKIETIDKAEGLFDISGHKYKIRSFALEAFDAWLSGYDVVAYTNDESFIELEYPCEVIMKCTLVSGSTRKFVFKKCELLLAN